ncbi:hypothetical protein A2U01_0076161, partial [Trifolium medium]|nr:hypothetical protein [Trifolium medium]
MEGNQNMGGSQNMQAVHSHKNKNKRGNGGITINGVEGVTERTNKETKLATRGSASFKAKTGNHVRKGVESVVEKMG